MTLHRSRTWRIELLIAVAALPALTWAWLWLRRDMTAGLPPAIVGRELVIFLLAAIATPIVMIKTLSSLRFRFIIDADGLTIRTADLTAALRWSDIESIVLDDLRILVAPGPSYRPDPYPGITRLPAVTPDGRACFEILALSQVRESPDQIASALTAHAGGRFTDARNTRPVSGR